MNKKEAEVLGEIVLDMLYGATATDETNDFARSMLHNFPKIKKHVQDDINVAFKLFERTKKLIANHLCESEFGQGYMESAAGIQRFHDCRAKCDGDDGVFEVHYDLIERLGVRGYFEWLDELFPFSNPVWLELVNQYEVDWLPIQESPGVDVERGDDEEYDDEEPSHSFRP
ncbi:hypothetical protein [Thalassospira xiamenensis]|uniref:Uncharacterized protein n=1 Tax=Thalassospira xiamenensis TaxID=220697 RepID=A0A285TRW6_9PROT|nr:hypothetical protein [Thalassospira xiamenensis]SOC26126.1 hypothetical protein SAMN05428964_10556 [Thalassospira xiamenensis]